MEKKFNSQICTTREQSERLLALGLNPETADCYLFEYDKEKYKVIAESWLDLIADGEYYSQYKDVCIPAWSLDRLIEMMPKEIKFPLSGMPEDFYFELRRGLVRYYNGYVCCVMEGGGYYNGIIDSIEWLIKKGYFQKESIAK